MTITNCKKCGKGISPTEKTCPHCNTPIKEYLLFSNLSIILGVLSCFYTFTFTVSFIIKNTININTKTDISFFNYSLFFVILITSTLSFIFAQISNKKGIKNERTKIGKITSLTAFAVTVLFGVIFLF